MEEKFNLWIKEFYDKNKALKEGNYEYFRWFSSKKKRVQYKFTTYSLLFHLRDIEFDNCLDIGCGPGTWTKLLLKKYPNAKFTCLDISKEMLNQFKKTNNEKRITFVVDAFTDKNFKNKYDFIISSRSIEYMENKPKVINKIYDLLKENGKGIIVTSPPHPLILNIKRFFGKKINYYHTRRISVKQMRYLLKEAGFKKIKVYPILFSDFSLVPRKFLFKFLYKKSWGVLSKMFASGYIVKFQK